VLLLYFGAMRKSELAALRVGDVATVSRGIEVTFVRSKTDQTGKGEVRAILPQAEAMMCAVHAWHAWLEHYRPPSPSAPAFVAFARDGTLTPKPLAYQSIDGVITCRCKDAGIRNISPHLLRAAFATHAIERNEEGQVAYHGRWKSRSTMDRYVRRGKTWIKNPTGNMGGASGT
jgi:integrase